MNNIFFTIIGTSDLYRVISINLMVHHLSIPFEIEINQITNKVIWYVSQKKIELKSCMMNLYHVYKYYRIDIFQSKHIYTLY